MSTATSYACFGCVDFANNRRTRAYTSWACSTGRFSGDAPQLRWMCECDDDITYGPDVELGPMTVTEIQDGNNGAMLPEIKHLTIPSGTTGTFTLSMNFGGDDYVTDPITISGMTTTDIVDAANAAGWWIAPSVNDLGGGVYEITWGYSGGNLSPLTLDETLAVYPVTPGEAIEFTNPIDDSACWYDPLIPESADFLGIIVTDVRGLRNSSFSRETEQGLTSGTLLDAPFIAGKQLVFEAIIVATSCEGMDYGIEWMRRQFEDERRCPADGVTCASCQGQLLTLRVHCPKNEDTVDRGLHSFPVAGTIDGIDLVEDDYPMGRRNCCTMRRLTWTMQTQDGASYSTEPVSSCTVDVADGYSFQQLGNCSEGTAELPCCPLCASTCDPCTTDPGCDCFPPYVLEPEVVGGIAPCFSDPVCRCIRAIGLEDIPSGYDAALRLRFFAGWDPSDSTFQKFGLRNTVVRIFENHGDLPLPTTPQGYEDLTSTALPCTELGISWMPAGSELVIDGLTGQSWLLCNGRCVDHSSRVFSIKGNVFPLVVRCVPLIATVEWDCLSVQDDAILPAIPSSMTLESYTRHRL